MANYSRFDIENTENLEQMETSRSTLKKVGRFIYYFFIILAFSFCTGIGSAIIGAILGLIIGTVINLIFALFVLVFSAHDVKLSDQILIIFVQIGFAIGSISGVYFGGNTINQWFIDNDALP